MKVEIVAAQADEPFGKLLIDGHEQKASAVFFTLKAGRESMTVWKLEGEREAEQFLAKQP